MFRCIYSLDNHEDSNEEHILQNSLGARWVSNQIVSNDLQQQFGDTVDLELANGLKEIRNLFGTMSGRGRQCPDLRVETVTGENIDLSPGMVPRLRAPIVEIGDETDAGTRVRASIANHRQLGWALHQIREQVPEAQINEAAVMQTARRVRDYVRQIEVTFVFGGQGYFRGMLKSAFNLLGVSRPDVVFDDCFNGVRGFVANDQGESNDFVRWIDFAEPLQIPRLGPADHFVGIVSQDGCVYGVVQYFGDVVHAFEMTNAYEGTPIKCSYLVDPFREAEPAEIRNPEFAEAVIPHPAQLHRQNNAAVQAAMMERLTRIVAVVHERASSRALDDVIRHALGPMDGRPFDEATAARVAESVARFMTRTPEDLGPAGAN